MHFLRCVILIMICIIVIAPGITRAEKNTLIVGTKEAPPFAMKAKDGSWTGISVDLWERIADDLNLKFEFHEFDLPGLLNGVADGSLDVGVAALTMTAEREAQFDFTHSFYATGLGIAVPYKDKTPWMNMLRGFLKAEFLKAVAAFCIVIFFVGTLVWLFEKKKNSKHFDAKPARGDCRRILVVGRNDDDRRVWRQGACNNRRPHCGAVLDVCDLYHYNRLYCDHCIDTHRESARILDPGAGRHSKGICWCRFTYDQRRIPGNKPIYFSLLSERRKWPERPSKWRNPGFRLRQTASALSD